MNSTLDPTAAEGTTKSPQAGEPQLTTASRVSFGVELEFFVAWVYEDEMDPDEAIASELAPLLRIPKKTPGPGRYVKGLVAEALATAGLPCQPWAFGTYSSNSIQARQAQCHDDENTSFRIIGDCSLKEFPGLGGYHMEGVELVSPAMFDRDNSFDLIHLAVSTLTSKFRCRVNQSCGFHVHVGVGKQKRIDPRTLRRLGALVWAASPILSQLHAPDRVVQDWSQGIRECMRVKLSSADATAASLWRSVWDGGSTNWEPKRLARIFGRDRWLGETYEAEDMLDGGDGTSSATRNRMGEPGRHWQDKLFMAPEAADKGVTAHTNPPNIDYEPPVAGPPATVSGIQDHGAAPPRPRHPPFERRIPHVPLRPTPQRNRDIISRVEPWVDSFYALVPQHIERATRRDVMSGVREVLAADFTGGLVGQLFGEPGKHTTYNFSNYSMDTYDDLEPSGMTTIELREAGGSLDPVWIGTWARIACRLLEWSRDACDADFFRVVRLLAWAQEEGGRYDVVDFLVDLNLLAEARICEGRLERGVEAWFECLLVAPSKEERRSQKEKLESMRRELEEKMEAAENDPERLVTLNGVGGNEFGGWE